MDQIKRRNVQLPYRCDSRTMEEQKRARRLLQRLNTMDSWDLDGIRQVVEELFGTGKGAVINPPFYCDYGSNIHVGKCFYANYNCTILDVARVTIGDYVKLGPGVSVYTAGHPIHPETRRSGYEYGIEVTIGSDVWIGGQTVICPGVRIGDGCVIGAGSVVTRDIPAGTIAAGNPCRVIRPITEEDRKTYFRDRQFDAEAWADVQQILKG